MNILEFLIGPYPLRLETIDKIFAYVSVGALILGVVLMLLNYFKNFNPVAGNLVRRFKNLSLFYGISGLVWSAFRYEGARYLEWRLWFVSITIAALTWLARIITYLFMGYKKDKQNFYDQQVKHKYLRKS